MSQGKDLSQPYFRQQELFLLDQTHFQKKEACSSTMLSNILVDQEEEACCGTGAGCLLKADEARQPLRLAGRLGKILSQNLKKK
jgi:hypothetical protein